MAKLHHPLDAAALRAGEHRHQRADDHSHAEADADRGPGIVVHLPVRVLRGLARALRRARPVLVHGFAHRAPQNPLATAMDHLDLGKSGEAGVVEIAIEECQRFIEEACKQYEQIAQRGMALLKRS